MALLQKKTYTEEDYYNNPEDIRMELIDGQIYYQAAPQPDSPGNFNGTFRNHP